jgi:hypothetical protein
MLLDAATIRDLEILSPLSKNGQSVWSFVDRTHTRAGRLALRDRLIATADSRDEILARQRAHKELAGDSDAFSAAIRRTGCELVEQYLYSNWQLPKTMRTGPPLLRSLRRVAWYGHYLSEVRAGRDTVEGFLRSASALQQMLANTDADRLRQSADALAALLDAPEARTLLTLFARGSRAGLTAFDQFARGDGRGLLFRLIDAIGEVDAMWSLVHHWSKHGRQVHVPAQHRGRSAARARRMRSPSGCHGISGGDDGVLERADD